LPGWGDADRTAMSGPARHQRRDASCRAYCAVSISSEQPAASAVIRGTDARAANRIGAKNPNAAKTSRLPTMPSSPIVGRSCSGTRLSLPGTMPAPEPGISTSHTKGSVP